MSKAFVINHEHYIIDTYLYIEMHIQHMEYIIASDIRPSCKISCITL